MTLRRLAARFGAFARKEQIERELDDEIRAHIEMAEREAVAKGLTVEEARREARVRFGAIEQIKEEHRDRRGIRWMEWLAKDFRHGMSFLYRSRGFSFIAACVLALGIGGTVAMFSIVDAVLLKPLPFPEPERIVRLWEAPRPGSLNATTGAQFVAWKRAANFFDAFAAEKNISSALNGNTGAIRLNGKLVTSEYFRVFGISAALGRTFTTQEDAPGSQGAVVLSHTAWETYFGADPNILSRRILLDRKSYQVIGVLQPGAFDRDRTQFWTPLVFTHEDLLSPNHWLTIDARLRPGISLATAQERMQAIYSSFLEAHALDEDPQGAIAMESLGRLFVGGNLERSITVAFGAVLVLLLIACANVANLLFARGATRQTELAVRVALGAGRGRLVLQLLSETLALCLLGGIAGIGLAYLLLGLAAPFLSEALPFTADVAISPRVLAFASAIILASALLTGLFPALKTSFGNLVSALNQSGRTTSASHFRIRRIIVVAEVGLSLILVSAAFLLLRSLGKLQQVETGVRIDNIVTASIDLPTTAYDTPEKAAVFYRSLSERLHASPAVAGVGLATVLPLHWISNGEGLDPGVGKMLPVRFKRVDSGYFRTLDIPVISGRRITAEDGASSARIAVINDALRKRLAEAAGMKMPVGKTIHLTSSDYLSKVPVTLEVQIVGVIRNERTSGPGSPDPPVVYVPLAQVPTPSLKLLVRSQLAASAVVSEIRVTIRGIDSHLPVGDIATMKQVQSEKLSGATRPAWLIGSFALIAVVLSTVGLYGLISYSITQRRRELGIRMALGAGRANVVYEVLHGTLGMIMAGLVFGLCGTIALTGILRSMLFEVSPLDPIALGPACAAMIAVGLIAGFVPAFRASKCDPVVSLRDGG